MTIDLVSSVAELRERTAAWRKAGERIALVPTMGALHAGHLGLVEAAAQHAERIVVSIFVNPTQFAPHEDFDKYPRTLDRDMAALRETKASLVYAPPVAEMYGEDSVTRVSLEGGPAEGLESVTRPHFFGGVATVVTKLLIQCLPDVALFGEKDYQQLKVITRMSRDLSLPVDIVGVPTMREPDGLALSSRNVYLSPEERAVAPRLHEELQALKRVLMEGRALPAAIELTRQNLTRAGFAVDYVEVRDAESLAPVTDVFPGTLRILAAARLGATRLIDNIAA